ncbi:MAG: HEAT repeat domain-containing protein, partial [Anaerolineae bacterium]
MSHHDYELLQHEYKKLRRTLHDLEARQARYGPNAPLDVVNAIDDYRQAISLLKAELERGEEATITPELRACLEKLVRTWERGRPVLVRPAFTPEVIAAHRRAIVECPDYARWGADGRFLAETGAMLPLYSSPYEDDAGWQREDLLDTLRRQSPLIVLGEAGTGKTTALERLMWEVASAEDETTIPILVRLLSYHGDLRSAVRAALCEQEVLTFPEGDRSLDAFLRAYPCWLFFDGLNEAPGAYRETVVGEVADFMRTYPGLRYTVTSRSQDRLWERLREAVPDTPAVVIQPIEDAQIEDYLVAWLGRKGKRLYERLDEGLRGLARRPLLLWLIKEAGEAGRELPANRGELFRDFVDRMLVREGKLGERGTSIPATVKKDALAALALKMHEERRLDYDARQAARLVDEHLKGKPPGEDVVAEAKINGLLVGGDDVRFLHQMVQEHFAAVAMQTDVAREANEGSLARWRRWLFGHELTARARDEWWAEVFVHLAGLCQQTGWLVGKVARVNPWLAYWCMLEGRDVDEEVRRAVEDGSFTTLKSPDASERRRAVLALARLPSRRTEKPLLEAIGDKDERVRRVAYGALAGLYSLPDLARLGNEDEWVRLAAALALGELEDARAVEPLIARLGDEDGDVRWAAAEALGKIGDARAVEPLIARLADEKWDVRLAAALALGKIGEPCAVEPLRARLAHEDSDVRRAGAEALGKIGDARAVEPLIACLGSEDGDVRGAAAVALGKIGKPRAIEPLMARLGDEEWLVRRAAAEALVKIGEPAVEALVKIGEPAVEPLIACLGDEDWGVRLAAALALGELGETRAIEPLIACLGDENEDV